MSCHLGGTSAYPWHTSDEILILRWTRVNSHYRIELTRVQALMHSTGLALESAIQQLGLNELFRNPLSPGPNTLVPVITVVNPCHRDLTLFVSRGIWIALRVLTRSSPSDLNGTRG
ncbi:hypothetical protein PIB30_029274 [Stylosanthes scabra]|uniref:Uncharacterized protein n=1 Tax=Stylosanthes scabra TaxID=79078 RepID=A0ABU6VDF4_9FABA|nr:hypothetical protein [Stylosanthes scabra]